jgi:hypothetical protein
MVVSMIDIQEISALWLSSSSTKFWETAVGISITITIIYHSLCCLLSSLSLS